MKSTRLAKRIIFALLALITALPVFTADTYAANGQAVTITENGRKYGGAVLFKDSTTYVGIRDYSVFMGADSVSWDGNTKTATVKSDGLYIKSRNGYHYIIANGRYLWTEKEIFINSGTMYLPLRTLAKAFNSTVIWNSGKFSAEIRKSKGTLIAGSLYYREDEVYWLSRIIHAEAGVEPFLGKVAVGTVVMNRVKSADYPDTIYGVIFDKKYGVQFTPAANGTVYETPDTDSIVAAKLCLDGALTSPEMLFFVNDRIAESSWVRDNRRFITAIGNHNFYA